MRPRSPKEHRTISMFEIPLRVDDMQFRLERVTKFPKPHGTILLCARVDALRMRLEAECPGDWSWGITGCGSAGNDSYVMGTLTIRGVSRSGVGAWSGKFGVRQAHDDAFRHACRMFGLGSQLWDGPRILVEVSEEYRKGWTKLWSDGKEYFVYPPNELIPSRLLPTKEQIKEHDRLFQCGPKDDSTVSSPGLFEEKPNPEISRILACDNPTKLKEVVDSYDSEPPAQVISMVCSKVEALSMQAKTQKGLSALHDIVNTLNEKFPCHKSRYEGAYNRIYSRKEEVK